LLTVYRIVKARHARGAFSGDGARLAGGRWHRPGEAAVYASSSLALAVLETFVQLGDDGLQIRFVHFRIRIPDSVNLERCGRPPRNWRAEPPQSSSMRYGSAWLRAGRAAVLEVPSAIVPSERNYLLNPAHPDFRRIQRGRAQAFVFDSRLWK